MCPHTRMQKLREEFEDDLNHKLWPSACHHRNVRLPSHSRPNVFRSFSESCSENRTWGGTDWHAYLSSPLHTECSGQQSPGPTAELREPFIQTYADSGLCPLQPPTAHLPGLRWIRWTVAKRPEEKAGGQKDVLNHQWHHHHHLNVPPTLCHSHLNVTECVHSASKWPVTVTTVMLWCYKITLTL